jgi:hypothetical protein
MEQSHAGDRAPAGACAQEHHRGFDFGQLGHADVSRAVTRLASGRRKMTRRMRALNLEGRPIGHAATAGRDNLTRDSYLRERSPALL